MVLAIIFLVIFAICAGVSIYFTSSLIKTPMIEIDFKKYFIKIGSFIVGAIISFLVASFGFYMWLNATPDVLHVVQLVCGGIFFIAGLLTAINCFMLHYYGKNIPEKLDKWLFRIILIGFTVSVIFFFIWTNGLAPYLSYPLINGINFTHGFVTPESVDENNSPISPNLAFYAICILSGAILVYFLCDHYMYKEYGVHGIFESTFFVAFPAGIIGGRIGYVVGNWHEFAGGNFFDVFAIWKGGLTILAGAPAGIIAGVAWFLWRNRDKSIWIAFDLVLPAILIAQAIGRWGNFFNCEVHGLTSSIDNWKWLPEIVWRNGQYSSESGYAGDGLMFVPLFFIECLVNLLGFFVLGHVFGKALRKYTELGDIGFGYIIWYGLTRVFMEPLRSEKFQMGSSGHWSWIWGMIFTFAGTLFIVVNHTMRYFMRKKNGKPYAKTHSMLPGLISTVVFLLAASSLIAYGVYLMTNNNYIAPVDYNPFNIGLILLVIGASLLLCLGISVPTFISGLNNKKQEAYE